MSYQDYGQGNQDQWGQQGGQGNQDQWGQQQSGQSGQGQGAQQQGAVHQARQVAGQQVDQAIDQFANQIPGGQQYSQQAKDAAASGLDALENEAQKRFGGMFGGNQ